MDNYWHELSQEAYKRQIDGIICRHIQNPDISNLEFGKTYRNTEDWVESVYYAACKF